MISVNENFINEFELEFLADYARRLSAEDNWDKSDPHPTWHNRYIHAVSLQDAQRGFGTDEDVDVFNLLLDVRKRIKSHIVEIRDLDIPIFADTLQIVRWLPGNEQHPHADSENVDGSPHPYPWRSHASIVYLNDDYEGGSIYFPQHDLELSPKPGTMVTFPGTAEYMHGVNKITAGERYSIASFWTFDVNRADGLPI
jgi:hypothetical protein